MNAQRQLIVVPPLQPFVQDTGYPHHQLGNGDGRHPRSYCYRYSPQELYGPGHGSVIPNAVHGPGHGPDLYENPEWQHGSAETPLTEYFQRPSCDMDSRFIVPEWQHNLSAQVLQQRYQCFYEEEYVPHELPRCRIRGGYDIESPMY